MLTAIIHLLAVIMILVGPHLPFMKAMERNASRRSNNRSSASWSTSARIVSSSSSSRGSTSRRRSRPRVRTFGYRPPGPHHPACAEADQPAAVRPRQFRRAHRGRAAQRGRADTAPPQPEPAQPQPDPSRSLTLPDAQNAPQVPDNAQQTPQRNPGEGVIADAIRNVQKYAQRDGFNNPQGGGDQRSAPVDSVRHQGRRVRAVAAPIRRADPAQLVHALRGDVDARARGRDVQRPQGRADHRLSRCCGRRRSTPSTARRQNAILASTPTLPLPPEYPDDKAFFTVTFYFNETPPGSRRVPTCRSAHAGIRMARHDSRSCVTRTQQVG